jgi:hypothetical protein
MSVFYMVEMHYPLDEDRAEFNDFYAKHISMLLTIEGFETAQRYECAPDAKAPFMAIYRLKDDKVLTRETYTSRAGRNSVDPVFRAKMTNWDRNLVKGPLSDMDVHADGWLMLIDRHTSEAPSLPDGFTPLRIIGLDATLVERGALIGGNEVSPPNVEAKSGWTVRLFKPVHQTRYPS